MTLDAAAAVPAWAPPTPAAMLEALDATWSALERVPLGPWVLRRGGGGGSRASSIMPCGAIPDDLDAALVEARRRSDAWGQPTIAQLGPDDVALDAALEARGWVVADRNLILAAPAAPLAAPVEEPLMAVRVAARLAALEDLWAQGGVGPARLAIMDAVAVPKARLLLRVDDRPAAACFVAALGRIAIMSALYVGEPFRRRGAGRALVAAAADWAVEAGADTLGLAVSADNAPARALYDRLGFAAVCGYVYRRAP